MKTIIPRSGNTLYHASLATNKRWIHNETVDYTLTVKCWTFTIVCNYNVGIHLHSRMTDLCLLLKDYTVIIIQGKSVLGGMGSGEDRGGNPEPMQCSINK